MSERPIISMMEGLNAWMMESGPATSEAANALPTVPEQASKAAVAEGMARGLPWARETNAAMRTSEYPLSCLVSRLLPKGQNFIIRVSLAGLGTFGACRALPVAL